MTNYSLLLETEIINLRFFADNKNNLPEDLNKLLVEARNQADKGFYSFKKKLKANELEKYKRIYKILLTEKIEVDFNTLEEKEFDYCLTIRWY